MAYGFSVRARDTRGLDPKTYAVNVGVHRLDGKPLSAEELEAIKAALAPEAANPEACAPAEQATGTGGE